MIHSLVPWDQIKLDKISFQFLLRNIQLIIECSLRTYQILENGVTVQATELKGKPIYLLKIEKH